MTVFINGRIATIFNKKASKAKYVSRERIRAQGRVEVIEVIEGEEEAENLIGKEVPFEMQTRVLPQNIRKNMYVRIKGSIDELTKQKKIIIVEDIIPTSAKYTAELYEKGIDINKAKNELISTSGEVDLIKAMEKGYLPELKKTLYSQELSTLQEMIESSNLKWDIEMYHKILTFFYRRARARGYEYVTEMIKENPWVLAEVEDFKLVDVEKVAKTINPGIAQDISLYAKLTNYVWSETRRGNSFATLSRLAYMMKEDLRQCNISTDKHRYYLANLATFHTNELPHRSMGKLVSYGQHDEEAEEYYQEVYSRIYDSEKASYMAKKTRRGIYLVSAFHSERLAAKLLAKMIGKHKINVDMSKDDEQQLDHYQKQAINNALNNKVSIIVGPAGSGKTFTLSKLVNIMHKNNYKVTILAPSALAAATAAVKTGNTDVDYGTIHRIARILPNNDDFGEEAGPKEENRGILKADLIIVDEAKMCNINTFHHLLYAMEGNENTHLVLVGDTAQLGAIGPSGFYDQLVNKGQEMLDIPVTRLEGTYRSNNLDILELANCVRKGKFPKTLGRSIHIKDITELENVANSLKDKGIENEDILFLSPVKAGKYGTINLNILLRKIFNPDGEQIEDLNFAVGDPVIAIKSDLVERAYKRGFLAKARHPSRETDVYNGTRGVILSYNSSDGTVIVRYNMVGKIFEVPYTVQELSIWIMPSYALTVHKLQGGEADYVVFIDGDSTSLTQNMLYTGITRSRKELYLVGKKETWRKAAKNIIPEPISKFIFRAKEEKNAFTNSSFNNDIIQETDDDDDGEILFG